MPTPLGKAERICDCYSVSIHFSIFVSLSSPHWITENLKWSRSIMCSIIFPWKITAGFWVLGLRQHDQVYIFVKNLQFCCQTNCHKYLSRGFLQFALFTLLIASKHVWWVMFYDWQKGQIFCLTSTLSDFWSFCQDLTLQRERKF